MIDKLIVAVVTVGVIIASVTSVASFIYLITATVVSASAIYIGFRRSMRKMVREEIDAAIGELEKRVTYNEGVISAWRRHERE